MYGAIRARWAELGWERSGLGYPVSDEYEVDGGRRSDFEHGWIRWDRGTGQTEVHVPG
ncbi:LGFP repeat-containing protein [Geodermatophilus sp. SYSU D00703]